MHTVNTERALKGFMWLAVALGAYSRLFGLGTGPLAVDEYFIAQSVDNVLKHGVPAFDCGGYYMRGLTLQYVLAPLYAMGLSAEFAGRLVTVICSFIALPAVYILGKRLSGVTVACVSVALLSLSLWEIEFARFARMYMPFQAIFLWYLVVLHRVVVDHKTADHRWLWLLSVAGVLTWKGGLIVLVVNFLPSVIERTPGRVRRIAVSTALLTGGYFYSGWNFRFLGGQPAMPPDVPIAMGGSHVIGPPVLASTLSSYPAWMAGFLPVLLVSLVAVVFLLRARETLLRERIVWAALIGLSVFNLFGCVIIGATLAVLLEWIDIRRVSRRGLYAAAAAIAASLFFWLAYAVLTRAPHQLYPGFGPGGELSKLFVLFFKYPNVFDSMLFPWLESVPVLTAALYGLLGLTIVYAVFAENSERLRGLRLTLAVFVILAALIGVAGTKYDSDRYSFFLLPLLYLFAVTAIHALIIRPLHSTPKRALALGVSLVALVGATEDFSWSHLIHMSSPEWNYRLPFDQTVSNHYYPRLDHRTPAEYTNRRARPNDVIITTTLPVAYYLKRTDYVYRNFGDKEFAAISCDAGRRERWTGSRLIYRLDDLKNVIDTARGDVWLIQRLGWRLPPPDVLKQQYSADLVYRGRAGVIGVFKISRSQ